MLSTGTCDSAACAGTCVDLLCPDLVAELSGILAVSGPALLIAVYG